MQHGRPRFPRGFAVERNDFMTPPLKNQVYTAEILGYSSEGLGIARIGGQVVFVHNAIRGEVCDILVMKVLKNAAYGKVVGWQQVSPHRVEPDCPHYRRCGGCQWLDVPYHDQLARKQQTIKELERIVFQAVAYKSYKDFEVKSPLNVSRKLDLTKFFKLHCFRPGVYFDRPAIEVTLYKEQEPRRAAAPEKKRGR